MPKGLQGIRTDMSALFAPGGELAKHESPAPRAEDSAPNSRRIAEKLFDCLITANPEAVKDLALALRKHDETFHRSPLRQSPVPALRWLAQAIAEAGNVAGLKEI